MIASLGVMALVGSFAKTVEQAGNLQSIVAQQVRGKAGDYQVPLKTGKALGHAYGGGSQFFAMWVVGSEKP